MCGVILASTLYGKGFKLFNSLRPGRCSPGAGCLNRFYKAVAPGLKHQDGKTSYEMKSRIERAIDSVSLAFRMLSRSREAGGEAGLPAANLIEPHAEISLGAIGRQGSPGLEPSEGQSCASEVNRRRGRRVKMALPVCVTGYEDDGCEWTQIVQTINVSRTGLKVTSAAG